MSLRVGVDAWNLPHDRRGIGRYVRSLLQIWSGLERRVECTLVIPEPATLVQRMRYGRAAQVRGLAVCSRRTVERRNFDLLWFPWNGMSWTASGAKVATLHDASLFAFPADGDHAIRERRPFLTAIREGAHIIADSEFSRTELMRYLAIPATRIDAVPLGVSAPAPIAPGWVRKAQRFAPYLLYVGAIESRKEFEVLQAALRSPNIFGSGLRVLVAGAARSQASILEIDSRVTFLGNVSDEFLPALYACAVALVYPSRYEGFGLPILEAMNYGCAVVCSDAPALVETGGDAALYFPSGDAERLASAVLRLQSDQVLRDRLCAKGRVRAATMSWKRCAERTLDVFERIAPS